MSEWQPIATAPLYEKVLLCVSPGVRTTLVPKSQRDMHVGLIIDSSTMLIAGVIAEFDWWTPTHWMPLPDPLGDVA